MLTEQDIKKLTKAQEGLFATKKDIFGIQETTKKDIFRLQENLVQEMTKLEERVTGKFSDLQASVDRYLKFTEAWHQELTILKSRQDRLSQVLIDKGIVSEKELALLG